MDRYKVKLEISYDGSLFNGFQKQKSGPPTVQGALEKALTRLLNKPTQVVGAGRTDKGVHALKSYVHFWTNKNPSQYQWVYALNGPLTPEGLVIKKAWLAPDDFHALSSEKKTYKYVILNQSLPSPFKRLYTTYERRPLKVEKLNLLSTPMLGTHDFSSFETSGTDSKTPNKTIFKAQWSQEAHNLVIFTIQGDGFLRQMVRNLVGTLLWMYRNGHPPEKFTEILGARDRQAARDTAPPEGLYLCDVTYSQELDKRCREL